MADANAAYYATHDPFRDFTTAPEISQVFGELLSLWAAVVWEQMGSPARVRLVELGPGRGTLMRDALRAVGRVAPRFAGAVEVHLVETSQRLRGIQAGAVPGAIWHDRVEEVPDGPMIMLANEFLDALPVRQFVRRGGGWMERHVEDGAFVERTAVGPVLEAAEGAVVEVNEAALAVAAAVAGRLAAEGGAALFLDYGPGRSGAGDSLQALRAGRPADPLAAPGGADLTAHVDFEAFAAAARRVQVYGPVAQGKFLARPGAVSADGGAGADAGGGGCGGVDAGGAAFGRAGPDGRIVQGASIGAAGTGNAARVRSLSPEFLTSAVLGTSHGFFTRRGGVSTGPYASLNCSMSSQDDPAAVAENRALVARALGGSALVGVTQVHGAAVVRVEAAWAPGAGARADAMVTDRPGIALGIITADCAPVLLHDGEAGVIGAVHAGWRGAVGGVLEATVAAMRDLGSGSIRAAIGPCIRQASYEVAADLRDAVVGRNAADARYFRDGAPGRWQFDLAGYCAGRLGGVEVDVLDADTLADEARFFSHRRRTLAGGGPIGHQISAIVL